MIFDLHGCSADPNTPLFLLKLHEAIGLPMQHLRPRKSFGFFRPLDMRNRILKPVSPFNFEK